MSFLKNSLGYQQCSSRVEESDIFTAAYSLIKEADKDYVCLMISTDSKMLREMMLDPSSSP